MSMDTGDIVKYKRLNNIYGIINECKHDSLRVYVTAVYPTATGASLSTDIDSLILVCKGDLFESDEDRIDYIRTLKSLQ